MSFGNKRLDDAYDRWVTQTPEEYFGYDEEQLEQEEYDDEEIIEEKKRRRKKKDAISKDL